jgi:hypothetical protein
LVFVGLAVRIAGWHMGDYVAAAASLVLLFTLYKP